MDKVENDVIKLVKKGYSFREIATELEKGYMDILNIKEKLMRSGELTEQDIIQGKELAKINWLKTDKTVQKVFKYKKQGLVDEEIADKSDIPVGRTMVSKYIQMGFKYNLISQEEIDNAKYETEKSKKMNDPVTIRIIEGLKRGEPYTMIAEDTPISNVQVKNITKWLINEKIMTQKEIEQARLNFKNSEKQNNDNAGTEIISEDELMKYLVLGYDNYDIRRTYPKLNDEEYLNMIDNLIRKKRITREEIKEYKQIKRKKDKIEVLRYLKQGMSKRSIADKLDTTQYKVRIYIEEIKKEENITDADILNWKDGCINSIKNRKKAVLEGLKLGLSIQETIDKYPEQELKPYDVSYIRKKLISDGIITKEEIEKYRQLREDQESKTLKLTDTQKIVLMYLKHGLSGEEIAEKIQKNKSNIYNITSKLKKKGKITTEQIEQYREQRKIRDERNKTIKIFDDTKRDIDLEVRFNNQATIDKEEKIKKYIELCFQMYEKEIPKTELDFLEKAMKKVTIQYRDFINYIKMCISSGYYDKAIVMFKNIDNLKIEGISKENEIFLNKLENYLVYISRIEKAIQIMKKGNTNTQVLSDITGLSKDYINILKIKLSKKEIRFLDVSKREKIIELLLQDKNLKNLYQKLQMSDFEIQDIEEQALYRRQTLDSRKKNEKIDLETETKLDSMIRIIVLYTKLGKSKDNIANILDLHSQKIEDNLETALGAGMIKTNELQGINLLDNNEENKQFNFEDMQKFEKFE